MTTVFLSECRTKPWLRKVTNGQNLTKELKRIEKKQKKKKN